MALPGSKTKGRQSLFRLQQLTTSSFAAKLFARVSSEFRRPGNNVFFDPPFPSSTRCVKANKIGNPYRHRYETQHTHLLLSWGSETIGRLGSRICSATGEMPSCRSISPELSSDLKPLAWVLNRAPLNLCLNCHMAAAQTQQLEPAHPSRQYDDGTVVVMVSNELRQFNVGHLVYLYTIATHLGVMLAA